jgi:polysaccharide export outer membrane protein
MRFGFSGAVLALLLLHASAGAAVAQQSDISAQSPAPLKIGSGDLLEVSVYDSPDLAGRYRVDEKGDISVPLLGLLHVEGLTALEAGKSIEKRYVDADILKPHDGLASVFISEYATQGISVSGDVKMAGFYPALGVRTLQDVITAAGGVSPTASSKLIITRKSDPDNPITVEYNPTTLNPVIPRIQIFPGDSIMVPRAGVVYVLGKVAHPGAYILEGRQSLTVEKAMALAGSSGQFAAMNHAHLVRTLPDGRKEDIHLDVDKIQEEKAPDIAMKDGDILFIPQSNSKMILLQAINSALGIGTSIAVYKVGLQP